MMRNYLVLSTGELEALLRFARTKSPEPSDTACIVLTFGIYTDEPFRGQAHTLLVRTPSGPDHRLNFATMTHQPVIPREIEAAADIPRRDARESAKYDAGRWHDSDARDRHLTRMQHLKHSHT